MRITTTRTEFQVRTDDYTATVSRAEPKAGLTTADGRDWGVLSLIASVHRTDGRDEGHTVEPPVLVEQGEGRAVFRVVQHTSAWRTKTTLLTCTDETVEVGVRVSGSGAISELTLLGGRAVLDSGAAGTFRSEITAGSVFSPAPTQPVQFVRPATSAAALGAVGDAEPGRLNGVFSPPPLVFAFGARGPTGATGVPEGPWLGVSVRAAVAELTFTQLGYEPLDGGYLLRCDYEGHTAAHGAWTSPTVVLRPADSPWQAVTAYRRDLVAHGLAPEGSTHPRHDWWRGVIFCGWGAQCARAAAALRRGADGSADPLVGPDGLVGGDAAATAPDWSRQVFYDTWLERLEEHGIVPGTIVIDDRWQQEYGRPEPDPRKWPRLREWIAAKHERGQRVLLWWRAWAFDGLPAEECVRDRTGRPVAADPTHPAYLRRLRADMHAMLGPGGLGADGLKIDFTQRTPSGESLRTHGDNWGISLLHEMLAAMYGAAKRAKPDALMITHTPHPSFADVCDMVRLNDVLETDPRGRPVPAVDQLRFRHAVATHALPGHPIDTDQWPMPSKDDWLLYAQAQPALGVPALYYVERIDNTGEEITGVDLRRVAAAWTATDRGSL